MTARARTVLARLRPIGWMRAAADAEEDDGDGPDEPRGHGEDLAERGGAGAFRAERSSYCGAPISGVREHSTCLDRMRQATRRLGSCA